VGERRGLDVAFGNLVSLRAVCCRREEQDTRRRNKNVNKPSAEIEVYKAVIYI
jgi:hypothetical protein